MKSISNLAGTPSVLVVLIALVVLVLPTYPSCNRYGAVEAATARNEAARLDRWQRKLQTVGGYTPTSVNDAAITAAANYAFGEVSNFSIGPEVQSSDVASYEVVGASTQVVAGLNIKLDMLFLDSSGNCLGAATVVVYSNVSQDLSITSWIPTQNGCPSISGGYAPTSVDDAAVTAAANYAFGEVSNFSIGPGVQSSDVASYEVVGASTQVVAGLNIKLDMLFLDSSGNCLGAATVVVYSNVSQDLSITSWIPTQNGCPSISGGYTPASVEDDAAVTEAANFVLVEVQASEYSIPGVQSSDVASYEVVGASTQVVAGLNIKLDMLFLDSSGNCVGGATVVVYSNVSQDLSITSWDPTQNGCPTLTGGYKTVSIKKPSVTNAAEFAYEQLPNFSSESLDVASYEVVGASEQVVSGTNLELDMVFLDSSGKCVEADTVVVYKALSEVLSIASWKPTTTGCPLLGTGTSVADTSGTDTSVADTSDADSNIDANDETEDPPVVGGYQPVPVDDAAVMLASNFVLEEVQASNYSIPGVQSSDVAGYEVVGASEQVVAGLNIKLDMVFQDSSGGCVGVANVLVYDKFGDFSITSWDPTENGCSNESSSSSKSIAFLMTAAAVLSLSIIL